MVLPPWKIRLCSGVGGRPGARALGLGITARELNPRSAAELGRTITFMGRTLNAWFRILVLPSVRIHFRRVQFRPAHGHLSSGGGPSFQDSEIWGGFVSAPLTWNFKAETHAGCGRRSWSHPCGHAIFPRECLAECA